MPKQRPFNWSRPLRKYRLQVTPLPQLPGPKPVGHSEVMKAAGLPFRMKEPRDNTDLIAMLPGLGSSLEGKVAAWLLSAGWYRTIAEMYQYSQFEQGGGRNTPGGHVIDFVLPPDYPIPTIISVEGTYFHALPNVTSRDVELEIWALANNIRLVKIPEEIIKDNRLFSEFMLTHIGRR